MDTNTKSISEFVQSGVSSSRFDAECNITEIDFADRSHLRFTGPIIDIHAHLFLTRASDPPTGPPIGRGPGPEASLIAAETMLDVASSFGIVHTVTMCLPEEIPIFQEHFGDKVGFNCWIGKKPADPDGSAYKTLDQFLTHGVSLIKLWAAPRGRDWGMTLDTPWRVECVKRARAGGVRTVMVHVADPDAMFRTLYADVGRYGTKAAQYVPLRRLLEEFSDMTWIAAHMGGHPEDPEHLEQLLVEYPHLSFDTSATKWQVREVSPRGDQVRELICRYPKRFLFGVDLVTRHGLPRQHYESRYWCQRTLWESRWRGVSPISDPDYMATETGESSPELCGVGLPPDVLAQVYFDNAARLLHLNSLSTAPRANQAQ